MWNPRSFGISALAALMAIVSTEARAQDAPAQSAHAGHDVDRRVYEGPPLSLADAVADALARNPDVAALQAQLPVARARPAQERSLAPPMLEAQIWQWPINTFNPANTSMFMLMVEQEIPGRGKRDLKAAISRHDVALAESDVAVRNRQIANEVRQAYTALYIARTAIDIHLSSVALLRQIADVSQAKYAAGRISQQDVLKPVTEISRHHGDILMFEEQAGIAAARLNILRDRSPDAPIGPLTEPAERRLLPPAAEIQQLALQHQPELQKAAIESRRAEAELTSVQQDYKPDFTVQGGYQIMPRETDAWMARVGITWPRAPWSRRGIDARVAERSAAVGAAKARLRSMENSLRLMVQEAYIRATSAQERAALVRTTILPQAEQTFDVSRIAYQADRVDFQTVIDNQRMLLDSQLEYFRAVSEFEQAIADLERAAGTELPSGSLSAAVNGGTQR